MAMAPRALVNESTNGKAAVDLQPGVSDPRERRIQRSGVWQAVASNPALIGYAADIESLQGVIQTLAEAGLKWVNEA